MRLRRLDLTRYGKFTGATLDFGVKPEGAPDLHIVYGLNEAGKSTALSATLDLLFGIEHASRYNFLHPYPTMEVGAAIEVDGASHELIRLKRGSGQPTLFHPDQRQASEALLVGALSGLGRDAYRTMFSLDDETLENGGNAILQSRGDLGELLFSASAGLAEIGATLAKTAGEADAIHKKRSKSSEMAGLKQRLAELKLRRETLDTAASAYAALAQTADRASKAYEAGMAERGENKVALDRAARLLKAAPDADRYRATLEELAAYEGLPRAPEAWGRELPALRDAETRIAALVETARERAAHLSAEIDRLAPDEAILAVGDEIRALREAMSRYATAEEDLPRRRIQLAERDAGLAGILERLGQGGHETPAALILPATVTGLLRELIEARSGVEARLRTAEEELARASEAFEAAEREAERPDAGEAAEGVRTDGDERTLRRLAEVLRLVRASDAPVRLKLAGRERPQVQRRLAEAMTALGAFEGDAKALAALVPPDAKRVEAWRASLADLERRGLRHRERRQEQAAEAAAAGARLETIRRAAGAIDDAEALRLREARAAAWARHRTRLDAESAEAFEAALAADDRIVEARVLRAQDLADLRQYGAALGVAEAGLSSEDAALAAIEAETARLRAEITDAVPAHLAPRGEGRLGGALDRIEAFALRRAEALAAAAALADLDAKEADARCEAEAEREALTEAYRRAGALTEPLAGEGAFSIADLASMAEDLIERCRLQGSERAAAQKVLAEREAQLQRRRQSRHEAVEALKRWQADWTEALGRSWIDRQAGVGAVREVLETLAALSPALRERDEMRHRVETMVADQDALSDELARLVRHLGEGAGDAAPPRILHDLGARLDEAERIRALAGDRTIALEAETAKMAALGEELRIAAARKTEMTLLFGVETLAEVGEALERVAERARAEKRLAELGRSLAADLRTATAEEALAALAAEDLAQAERLAGELEARQDDLDARLRELFAEKTKAADALAAIGGGDEVARIQTERQTVLIEMEEAARRNLRLRAGALVAEEALRTFRDRHRSTMMGRASQAFAAMTRGDYTGLSARPEKDRETLIGLSREGGSKLATDMSKGTRFQLYLALRLAGYEEFARARRPVPFLADDIMETFDEPRSEEVLRLLSGMAGIGQVVYFTHHRHLCDIAEAVEPGVRIHRL
ncbi:MULTISPECIES: AAA family ATPase [unclassified Aureimonas]|uniref:AAA family ATPase n=1 Tax=unclassified Aureimonas TaxID=2615206 RepID=UPI0006F80B93|nr:MULTISPECIES: AAA family ATPase [unclassified Aureimonas]KQT68899.1 hypothetical protein ASG54_04310 [Aureimonas sp. Leaf460]KQT69125.1 hypothetical protein ASG62_16915 [Aureimonas sp. Leaf427]